MICVFETNTVSQGQDDYLWYRLSESGWAQGPRSGLDSGIPGLGKMSGAFKSIPVGSGYLVIRRDSGVLSLTAGVPSGRVEVGQHRRQIADTLYLQADEGSASDESVLCGFAAACLVDEHGLGTPTSEVGAAVEGIWKSSSLDGFVAKFGGHSTPPGNAVPSDESWRYPRNDMANRRKVASWIPSLIESKRPFLVALTGRSPNEALQSIPHFAGVHYVFSSRVASAEKVARSDFTLTPSAVIEWAGRNRRQVAGIAAVLVALVAFVKTCSGPSPKPPEGGGKTAVTSLTNSPAGVKPCITNSTNLPAMVQQPDGTNSPCSSPTNLPAMVLQPDSTNSISLRRFNGL